VLLKEATITDTVDEVLVFDGIADMQAHWLATEHVPGHARWW
jgi:hypothetical protein|tara:strand:+ start:329 stop:454 length:126 start_codon:yes stop_codon:yes gene_type:complete